MTRTEALRIARSSFGPIHRRNSTDYVWWGPNDFANPKGPSCEYRANNYPLAVARRRMVVALCALTQLGLTGEEYERADAALYFREYHGKSLPQIVAALAPARVAA